jgi:hypothetical protein
MRVAASEQGNAELSYKRALAQAHHREFNSLRRKACSHELAHLRLFMGMLASACAAIHDPSQQRQKLRQ